MKILNIKQRLENSFIKGKIVNVLGFVKLTISYPNYSLCCYIVKPALLQIICKQTGVTIFQLNLRTLKFEFHVVFTCHGIYFFPCLSTIKKAFLNSWTVQKQDEGFGLVCRP